MNKFDATPIQAPLAEHTIMPIASSAVPAGPAPAQPPVGQPQKVVYAQQQPVAANQQPVDYRLVNRGVQPGGEYSDEKYCGLMSVAIGIFILPCICFCPVDSREVYTEPGTGRRVVLQNNSL